MVSKTKDGKIITIAYFNLFTWLGGGEYSVLRLVEQLDSSRFRALMLVNKRGPLVECTEKSGITTVVIPFVVTTPARLLTPQVMFKNLKASLQIPRVLQSYDVDIIHCSDVFSLLLLMPTFIKLQLPVVYNVIVFYSALRSWVFGLLTFFFVQRIVTNSHLVRNDLLQKTVGLSEKTTVAYYGVDTSVFYPRTNDEKKTLRGKLNLPEGKKIVGFVGRYDVWKGHLTFLDAAKQLSASRDDTVFLMVGGPITKEVAPWVEKYQTRVLARANELQLDNCLLIWNHRDDIPDVMAVLDVFVCPSDYEPFGLVALEAWQSGVPVVASTTVGAMEVLRDEPDVFEAEPKNAASFADRIHAALLYSPASHQSGRSDTAERFTWRSYAQQFEQLYLSAA